MVQWRRQAPATPLPRLTPSKHAPNGRSSTAKLRSGCGLIPAMLAFGALLVALSTFLLVHFLPWDNANRSSSSGPVDRDSSGNTRSASSGNARNLEIRKLEQSGLEEILQHKPYSELSDSAHKALSSQSHEVPLVRNLGTKDTPSLPLNSLEVNSCVPTKANGAPDAEAASGQAIWLLGIDFKGGDLPRNALASNLPSASACCEQCLHDRRDEGCMAWTYVTANLECWLKGSVPDQKQPKDGLVSGVIQGRDQKTPSMLQELARVAAAKEGEPSEGAPPPPGGRPNIDPSGRVLLPPRPSPRPPPSIPCCPTDLKVRPEGLVEVLGIDEDKTGRVETDSVKTELVQATNKNSNGEKLDGNDGNADDEPLVEPLWAASPAASWVEAYPIGNGILGALVWGGTWDDRMPIAEDTMYTPPPPKKKPPPPAPPKHGLGLFSSSSSLHEDSSSNSDKSLPRMKGPKEQQFLAVRDSLLAGDLPKAEEVAKGWGAGALGTFQYAAALRVGVRPNPVALDRLVDPAKQAAALPPQPPPPPSPKDVKTLSKEERAEMNHQRAVAMETRRAAEAKLLAADQPSITQFHRTLDLDSAVAHVSFTYKPSPDASDVFTGDTVGGPSDGSVDSATSSASAINGEKTKPTGAQLSQVHARESFASFPDGIIAQRLSCTTVPSSAVDTTEARSGCLHFALNFERDAAGKNVAMNQGRQGTLIAAPWDTKSWLVTLSNSGSSSSSKSSGKDDGAADGALAWHTCALVTVDGGQSSSAASVQVLPEQKGRASAMLDVRSANDAAILIAATTSYRHANPAEACAATLQRASRFSWQELKARHVNDHRKLFRAVNLQLTGPSIRPVGEEIAQEVGKGEEEAGQCTARAWQTSSRVTRLGQNCVMPTTSTQPSATAVQKGATTHARVLDPGLLSQWFQMGRYLLIASSRPGSQPANLQGVWADGLDAPWNGDYHLNINLQMCYWASHPLNLFETSQPLAPFLRQLATAGRQTAREWYGVGDATPAVGDGAPSNSNSGSSSIYDQESSPWVAHGYVDLWMDPSPHGDLQWSLCPTCGAWAALSLWDAYLFDLNVTALEEALPILRGAVRFFEGYLLKAPSQPPDAGASDSSDSSFTFVERMLHERTSRDDAYPSLVKQRKRAQLQAAAVKTAVGEESDRSSRVGEDRRRGAEEVQSDGSSSNGLWNWASNKVGYQHDSHQVPSPLLHGATNGDSGVAFPDVVLLSGPATSPENSYTSRVPLSPKVMAAAQAAIDKMADKADEEAAKLDLVAKEAEATAAKGGKSSPPQANAARSRAAAKRALDRAAKLRASKPESPPPHHHLTLSPTIDTAIVGALLRAYQDAVKTVQAHEQLNEASQLEQEFPSKESEGSADRNRNELQKGHEDKDLNIADDLALAMVASNLLAQLPNAGGWPLVGEKTGRIQEWLLDFEEPDPAHRHWSGLWDFFPGDLLGRSRPRAPRTEVGTERAAAAAEDWRVHTIWAGAARRTLQHKLAYGGGHTGWSAAWSVALAARLREPQAAHDALVRLVGDFTVPNLLSTHPALQPVKKLASEGCATCFELASTPKARGHAGAASAAAGKEGSRGLATHAGDVFQVDGNLGGAAAIAEILLQSHWHSLPVDPLPSSAAGQSDWLLNAWPATPPAASGSGGNGDGIGDSDSSSSSSSSSARGAKTLIELDFLPALPAKLWPSGRVKGLQTRGGLEVVSLSWQSSENEAASTDAKTGSSRKQQNRNSPPEHNAGNADERPTEELMLAAGAAEGAGAASLTSLKAKVRRPYRSISSSTTSGISISGSRTIRGIQAETTALALACSAEVRVRSAIPLEVVSWSMATQPSPLINEVYEDAATAETTAGAGDGAEGEQSTTSAQAPAVAASLRRATSAAHTRWEAQMTKGHAANQWRSTREMGGAPATAAGGEPALFFGAPYVLDLPPLPPGATLNLRSIR